MKKIFYFILLIVISTKVNAQYIGIRGGVNLSYQTFKSAPPNNDEYKESRNIIQSLNSGVFFEMPLTKKTAFHTGLHFSGKGSKYSYLIPNTSYTVNVREKLHYLELPLILKHYFNDKRVKIFTGVGPVLSYGFSGETDHTISGKFDSFEYYNNRFDVGILFQSGIRINKFSFWTEYNLSIGNLYSKESSLTTKNRVLSFSIAYFHKLKSRTIKNQAAQ